MFKLFNREALNQVVPIVDKTFNNEASLILFSRLIFLTQFTLPPMPQTGSAISGIPQVVGGIYASKNPFDLWLPQAFQGWVGKPAEILLLP